MMQENSVALEALCQAARLEEDGHKFYTEAAQRTIDPRGREMFLSLADDEKMHLRLVEDQYEAVINQREWISFPEALECKPIDLDKPLFPPEGHDFDKAIDPKARSTRKKAVETAPGELKLTVHLRGQRRPRRLRPEAQPEGWTPG
jgi:rubrerythrin